MRTMGEQSPKTLHGKLFIQYRHHTRSDCAWTAWKLSPTLDAFDSNATNGNASTLPYTRPRRHYASRGISAAF